MAEITSPRIDSDGTHVIPVRRIHRPGETPSESSVGEVRWSRRDGVTFQFQTLLTSFLVFPDDPPAPGGGAGSLSRVSFEPTWFAETSDGSAVRLYATSEQVTTSLTTSWDIDRGSGAASAKTVAGMAFYAEVGLHRDNPLAYWFDTPRSHRLFSPGWDLQHWTREDRSEYTIDGTTCLGTRCSVPLDEDGERTLVVATDQTGRRGVWLTYRPDPDSHPFWFPESCGRVRGLMSVLLGQRVAFVWRDTPASDDRLTRLYYGWHRATDPEHPRSQLVPLFGTVESLSHGRRVAEDLPRLDQEFGRLRELFDVEWVASPLWAADHDFMENQLTYACVALERLSLAYHERVRPVGLFAKPADFIRPDQKDAVLERLRAALATVAESERLTQDAVRILGKKITNICQPTNNDKLVMVFEELGIPVGPVEKQVISNRNRSLHGTKTLENTHSTEECDQELRRYDLLRTLIGRALLHLLGYEGPYVDYAARPDGGNFPIRTCTPPARTDSDSRPG